MHLILFAGVLKQQELHGHGGLDAGKGRFGRLPGDAQRAEVVKLPALVIEGGQVQHGTAVIRNRHLGKK